MNLFILATTLFSMLAAALPNNPAPGVVVVFSSSTECTADGAAAATIAAIKGCAAFPDGAKSLRVVAVSEAGQLRYNSRESPLSLLPYFFRPFSLPSLLV